MKLEISWEQMELFQKKFTMGIDFLILPFPQKSGIAE